MGSATEGGSIAARGASNSRETKSVITAVIGGEKFESFAAERRILAEEKARIFVGFAPIIGHPGASTDTTKISYSLSAGF